MKIKVQVVIEYENETTETVVEEIGCLQRAAPSIEALGIRLDEGKAILANLQESVIAHQVAEHMKKHEYCKNCIADDDCPHQRLDEAEYCEVYDNDEWYPSPTILQQRLSSESNASTLPNGNVRTNRA